MSHQTSDARLGQHTILTALDGQAHASALDTCLAARQILPRAPPAHGPGLNENLNENEHETIAAR